MGSNEFVEFIFLIGSDVQFYVLSNLFSCTCKIWFSILICSVRNFLMQFYLLVDLIARGSNSNYLLFSTPLSKVPMYVDDFVEIWIIFLPGIELSWSIQGGTVIHNSGSLLWCNAKSLGCHVTFKTYKQLLCAKLPKVRSVSGEDPPWTLLRQGTLGDDLCHTQLRLCKSGLLSLLQ